MSENERTRASAKIARGVAKVPEVRCTTHGVFDYKTASCPGCLADARRRYEKLVIEIEGDAAAAWQAARFKRDTGSVPISASALAALRHEDAAGADAVAAELERQQRAFAALQHQRELVGAALAALTAMHGKTHRLGSPAATYKGRLLGAVDVGEKRFARLQQEFLDGGEIVFVPWIDAFAERVGQEVAVKWLDTSHDSHQFHVSERDGRIDSHSPSQIRDDIA